MAQSWFPEYIRIRHNQNIDLLGKNEKDHNLYHNQRRGMDTQWQWQKKLWWEDLDKLPAHKSFRGNSSNIETFQRNHYSLYCSHKPLRHLQRNSTHQWGVVAAVFLHNSKSMSSCTPMCQNNLHTQVYFHHLPLLL